MPLEISTSLEGAIRFTEVFEKHKHDHRHIREIECLKEQFSTALKPIESGDCFAGRILFPLVGISPEPGDLTDVAYFCLYDNLQRMRDESTADEEKVAQIDQLVDYWKEHTTYHHCREAFPDFLNEGLPSDDYYSAEQMSYPMYGIGGPCLDYEKLVRLGVKGLREEIRSYFDKTDDEEKTAFYQLLLDSLDLFSDVCRRYAEEARASAVSASDDSCGDGARYELIAKSLEHIAGEKPTSFHEAIQLVWLFNILSMTWNYGRMDVYLGDFLADDLDSGRITDKEAFEMMVSLWHLMNARGNNFNNRVIIGGKGRPNEGNADRFALLALSVQEHVGREIPQLSVRWYEGMNPTIWDRAIEVIGKGSTFPILYNDDVNILAVEKAMGVTSEEAEQYMMYGCGEFVINHTSVGSPNAAANVLKAVDVTLHDGCDPFTGKRMGLAMGKFEDFGTFEELRDAVARQIDREVMLLAYAQEVIYRVTGEIAAFPFVSTLYDDCIARGKPLLAGGVRYSGGTLESFGNNSAADTLMAIKKAVYDEKQLTHEELLACVDSNFEGHERERAMLKSCPKYGNDLEDADEMSLWLNHTMGDAAKKYGKEAGLDSFLIVLVNNGDNVLFGRGTGATADGRKATQSLSNGNQPSAGADTSGLTALLNSMAKLDASKHAGATNAAKLSRQMFKKHPDTISALLKGYFLKGGTQIMITVTDRGELEAALEHPEEYSNLFVRVGGYTERFVNLPRDIQMEVLNRTLY